MTTNNNNFYFNTMVFKSANPKISRIDRQKRKNEFLLIWPKEPIWLPVFGNGIKRLDFLFFSSKFAKLENSATGPSVEAIRLEIWHMFNMLLWAYQTCLKMSFTQCFWHLLSFTRDQILLKNVSFYKIVNLRKPNHLRT